jgi:acyl-CoA thioesterase YciA
VAARHRQVVPVSGLPSCANSRKMRLGPVLSTAPARIADGSLPGRFPIHYQEHRAMTAAKRLTLPDEDPVLRVVPMPADANVHGDVFGGWIMAQVDIGGAIRAARRANGRVATVAVNSFVFKEPVFVGDVLSIYARILKTGRTSITVDIAVYAERSGATADVVKVTEAIAVYVATGPDRLPRVLPPVAADGHA